MTDKDTKNNERKPRPHVGVIFKCCNIYQRIYLNNKGNAFVGYCPKCSSKMEITVSPYGSTSRFFTTD